MCDALTAAVGYKVKRNIGQARDGGNDIDFGPFLVECKRRKTLGTVYGWLQQAIDSAAAFMRRNQTENPAIPIVVAREDNGESLVILRLADFLPLARPYVLEAGKIEDLL